MMMKTIGIIIIDPEFLLQGGNATDWNLDYVIQELTSSLRYQINKITVTSTEESSFQFELEHHLKQSDFVLLINNSKCDFVYGALARFFKVELAPHAKVPAVAIPARSKILEYNNSIKVHPVLYMSRLFLVQDRNLRVVFDNILKAHLRQFNKERVFRKKIVVRASDAAAIHSRTSRGVQLLHFHSKEDDVTVVEAVANELDGLLEFETSLKGVVKSRDCSDAFESIYNNECFPHVKVALECIEKCLVEYTPENVFLGFNGGKDCTVLLHLVLSVLKKKFPDFHDNRLVCMYVQSNNPFKEVNDFIDKISRYHNLEIITITKGVKEGLATFLKEKPHMKACLMGTRSTDPYSENLVTFQMTDPHWPQVMRVSPLLHWNYADIWDYLLYFQIPYCSLYDEGYTSLGSVDNTKRNPDLLYGLTKGAESYLPAYKLIDGTKERSGRQ